jgi:hypothetical protein
VCRGTRGADLWFAARSTGPSSLPCAPKPAKARLDQSCSRHCLPPISPLPSRTISSPNDHCQVCCAMVPPAATRLIGDVTGHSCIPSFVSEVRLNIEASLCTVRCAKPCKVREMTGPLCEWYSQVVSVGVSDDAQGSPRLFGGPWQDKHLCHHQTPVGYGVSATRKAGLPSTKLPRMVHGSHATVSLLFVV